MVQPLGFIYHVTSVFLDQRWIRNAEISVVSVIFSCGTSCPYSYKYDQDGTPQAAEAATSSPSGHLTATERETKR